jgi:predicted DsbA family dithiol-disulfide isomerase
MMRIDVWSDVACPWCYVGKRNLEAALAETGLEAEVHWRAFELDPAAPRSTEHRMDELLAEKYGMSAEQAAAANAQMTETARRAGLDYHLDTVQLANSFDAHRLTKLAEARGLGAAAAERLFAAYFTEGRLISDAGTLVELGVDLGLAEEEVLALLGSDAFAEEVRSDEATAQEAGFTGVPTFVVDGKFAIPGAQSTETMVRLLSRLAEEQT